LSALAAMETYESENLAQRANQMGTYFESRAGEKPLSRVRAVRRLGLRGAN